MLKECLSFSTKGHPVWSISTLSTLVKIYVQHIGALESGFISQVFEHTICQVYVSTSEKGTYKNCAKSNSKSMNYDSKPSESV